MSRQRGWFLVLVVASGCGADASARAQASPADPLPSWNDVAGQTAPGTPGSPATPPGSSRSLEATYWKAIEVAGKQIRGQSGTREAHLVFQAGGRMSGSDGCNRLAGSYELKGDGIAFGQTLGTQMACQGTGEIEQGFRAALKDANRWRIVDDRLELLDAGGMRLAAFEGRAAAP